MHELYELKEMLMKELEEYGSKGEMTAGSLEVVDKLAHTIKNLCKIIEASEEEYSSEGYAREGGSYRGGSYAQGGSNRRNYSNRGGRRSYAQGGGRGRGANANRDSMGRYSSEGGYSRNEEMVSELYELMEDAPDDKTRQEFQRFIQKLEGMQ